MEFNPEEFKKLIDKYTAELLEGISPIKMMSIDFLDLNKQAIKLAGEEWKKTHTA